MLPAGLLSFACCLLEQRRDPCRDHPARTRPLVTPLLIGAQDELDHRLLVQLLRQANERRITFDSKACSQAVATIDEPAVSRQRDRLTQPVFAHVLREPVELVAGQQREYARDRVNLVLR